MRFTLILAGMIFLFSPDISLFDILPDTIGLFLITLGLTPLADIELRAEDAKLYAKRMMLFSGIKLALSLFILRFSSADLLLAAFCYGIVELITVFPLMNNLFSGLDYTAMRVNASLDSDKLNRAKWYLGTFFVMKNILAVLPATVSLFDSSMTGNYSANTWFIDLDAAMRVITVFCFLMSVVLSVSMTVWFISFWSQIIKNRSLNEKMAEHRRITVLEIPACMIRKNTSFVLGFFVPAVVFLFDFYIDGVDILPTFVGFALALTGGIYAKRYMECRTLPLIITSALGTAVSLTAFLYRTIPLAKNSFVMDYAFSSKPLTLPLSAAVAVLTLVTVVLMLRLAVDFNNKYTRYKLEDSVVLYMLGGGVMAVFDLLLYAFPHLNTTFVFPSLIFGTAFTAMGAYYFIKLSKQIRKDNKI